MAKGRSKVEGERPVDVVSAVVFAGDGSVLWRSDVFVLGRDRVPVGVALSMRAAVFVDGASGEVVRRWNPWGVLDG